VKSPSNKLRELQDKCARYVQGGSFESWLINPESKRVEIYRSGGKHLLQEVLSVTGSGPLSSFVLDLTDIWAGTIEAVPHKKPLKC
jgi:Uma2 family endonuclease